MFTVITNEKINLIKSKIVELRNELEMLSNCSWDADEYSHISGELNGVEYCYNMLCSNIHDTRSKL